MWMLVIITTNLSSITPQLRSQLAAHRPVVVPVEDFYLNLSFGYEIALTSDS
jgi:hypothetical protein